MKQTNRCTASKRLNRLVVHTSGQAHRSAICTSASSQHRLSPFWMSRNLLSTHRSSRRHTRHQRRLLHPQVAPPLTALALARDQAPVLVPVQVLVPIPARARAPHQATQDQKGKMVPQVLVQALAQAQEALAPIQQRITPPPAQTTPLSSLEVL